MMCNKVLSIVVGLSLLITTQALLAGPTIGGIEYMECGSSETLTAIFAQPDGGVTTGMYSDLIKLSVTGYGESSSTRLNDAFYVFSDLNHQSVTPSASSSYYQLAVSTGILQTYQPAYEAKYSIVYDLDADLEVTPAYVPAYSSIHEYNFIIDLGTAVPSLVHFGVSNGIFSDNSGAYDIMVSQLKPIPAPSALLLCTCGLGVIRWLRGRRKL